MKLKTLATLSLLFLTINSLAQLEGQSRIDSLLKALADYPFEPKNKIAPEDTLRVSLLIELSYEYHRVDPVKGINFGEQGLQIANVLKWKKGIASSLNKIGLCYWAKSDYPKALEYNFKALTTAEETGDKKIIATILGNMGLVYENQRDYVKALDHHLRALKMNEELADKKGIARNLGNLGIVYDAQGDYENSLEYYFKALKLYEEMGDKNGIARNLGNIGFAYQLQNIYSKSLQYHYKALQLNNVLGNKILTGMNLGNIGAVYSSIANDTVVERLKMLPDSLQKNKVAGKAAYYLKSSIDIFEEIKDYNSLQELYLYLSDLQVTTGNHKEGLQSFKKYIASKDSVFNEANNRKIEQLEKTREEDLKQKEIELLKKQNEIERLTAQRRKVIIYGLGLSIIGLAFVTVAFFNQSKKRKRINIELQTAYVNLKETQEELVKQEKLASLGKLTSNIAHEIQNPLNFVNNFSEISAELTDELNTVTSEEERKEIAASLKMNLEKINHHGKRADAIVKRMQQHLREGTGLDLFDN
jgi:two-component system, NtrC family, sensor kinase